MDTTKIQGNDLSQLCTLLGRESFPIYQINFVDGRFRVVGQASSFDVQNIEYEKKHALHYPCDITVHIDPVGNNHLPSQLAIPKKFMHGNRSTSFYSSCFPMRVHGMDGTDSGIWLRRDHEMDEYTPNNAHWYLLGATTPLVTLLGGLVESRKKMESSVPSETQDWLKLDVMNVPLSRLISCNRAQDYVDAFLKYGGNGNGTDTSTPSESSSSTLIYQSGSGFKRPLPRHTY